MAFGQKEGVRRWELKGREKTNCRLEGKLSESTGWVKGESLSP